MFFRSERLFLRPAWPEDWSDLYHAVCDPAVVRNLAVVPWPYRPEHARDFARLPQDPRHPHFLVVLPGATGCATIGSVALNRGGAGRVELGYWIAQSHWGRGFATEAVRGALAIARTLRHGVIHATPFQDNPASRRVLRKAGFVPTGIIERRFSEARGETVPGEVHAIALDAPHDCDGGGEPLMRAA